MTFRWFLISCLFFSCLFFSSLFSNPSPNESNTTESRPQSSIGIQGIFLTGKREDILPEGRPTMTGIQAMDIEIPGGLSAITTALKPFLGTLVTQENVIAVKQKIMTYYVSKGVSTLEVEVPPQKTAGGVVQFLISKKYLGNAVYKGETWYNNEQLNRYLGVYPGHDISEDALQNNLSWLNQNPFQNTQMQYVPSDQADVLDIEFTSRSRRPIRIYERGDDTGSASTGYGRLASGIVWGNAFWIGDLLSFEYMFSNEFKRFQSYTASYTSFLPWKHLFTVLGTYAIIKPDFPNGMITAKAGQISPRYKIPFKPLYTPFQQSFQFGFDYKNTNSALANLATGVVEIQPTSTPPVLSAINVAQAIVDYTLFDTINGWGGSHSISLDVAFFASPFEFLHNQNNEAYNKQRPHSKAKYCYGTVTAGDVLTIPKTMVVSLLLRGQVASTTLPGTELFSIGGYNTVRGYHEAEISGDNGFISNLELRTLPFNVSKKLKDQLVFLTFIDYGISNNWFIPTVPLSKTRPHTQYLLGVGPGLRYMINPYLQVRCDYGFKLHQLFISNPKTDNKLLLGFGQFHVGVLASF